MFTLRPYQEVIPDKVFSYMRKNPGKHPLVAMPTGSGKTVVLSDVVLKARERWPDTKILIVSHVQEILEQDHNALSFHTKMPIGLYSSGLRSKTVEDVTVAGIQSIFRKPYIFHDFNLVIIDECHLIPYNGTSMYRKLFQGLNKPRYFGLTATPFRLGTGYIYGEEKTHIFDDLIYDLTNKGHFNKLIEDGYLCRLKTQHTTTELDVSGIHTVGGDFDKKEMSLAFNRANITKMACNEILKVGDAYKKWLIFAIDIEHAESIAEYLSSRGVPTMVIHSKMEFDRTTVIDAYKSGTFRAMVNVNVLTTGFDDPEIDLIAMLRPTKSPVVHIQTVGRGLRVAPGKDHCLIMDFAGNTERLGPINDVYVKKKQKRKGNGEPITKRCPNCDTIHHPSAKVCEFCGHKFQFKEQIRSEASSKEIINDGKAHWYNITDIHYKIHSKRNAPDMLKVEYQSGLRFFNEYVCIEHPGYAGYRAKHWAKFRGVESAHNAQSLLQHSKNLKKPTRIKVDTNQKYPVIVDYEF